MTRLFKHVLELREALLYIGGHDQPLHVRVHFAMLHITSKTRCNNIFFYVSPPVSWDTSPLSEYLVQLNSLVTEQPL